MLVRADAIPVLDVIKSAEAVDAEAAALWVHMACFDALNDEIAKARPEINRVWKSVVSSRSAIGRRALVRKAIERRIDGDEIDDVVRAGAGLALIRGAVAKADDDHSVVTPDDPNTPEYDARDRRGRFASRTSKPSTQQRVSYDAMEAMTQRDSKLRGQSEQVATQLQGSNYDRMRVLGNVMTATGNSHLAAAGGVTRAAAEMGPSAEQVLGPHLRRLAYRYRGTEKRPDQQLLRETKEAQAYVSGLSATPTNQHEEAYQAGLAQQLDERAPGEWGKGAAAFQLAQGENKGYSEDQLELRATGDVASAYLSRNLPTLDEAYLSQEAGRTPPSLGVLIDSDGDVVSESQGYQGDHYVPFDLKNLKRLHGGSYVRTRALGGPTSEDIYTGLLGGARQVQVVSRSGVFTIEFDPDLRGGRRYSDKAKQMVDRYSRILDRIEESQTSKDPDRTLYTQDVPPARERQLRAEALRDSNFDEDEAKIRFDRDMRRERAEMSLGFTDEELRDQADAEVEDWVKGQQRAGKAPGTTEIGRKREEALSDVRDQALKDKQAQQVRRLQLDAEGYFRAMQSLRREFPFYIRGVDFESLRDFETRRRMVTRDTPPSPRSAPPAKRTHVKRGELLPAGQAASYGFTTGGERKSTERRDQGEDEGTGVPRGRKPTSGDGSGGAAAALTFSDKVKEPAYQNQLQAAGEVFRGVHLGAESLGLGAVSPPPTRDEALAEMTDPTYLRWLMAPNNPLTSGTVQGVTRFLSTDATEQELARVSSNLQALADQNLGSPALAPDRVKAAKATIDNLQLLRFPFAAASGDGALHLPDPENPKPYPFAGIADVNPDDPEALAKAKSALVRSSSQGDSAITWAEEAPDDATLGRELHDEVMNFNAAGEWGKKIIAAREAGRLAPTKPASLHRYNVDGAVDIANDPKSSADYKRLLARQQAYALRRMESVLSEAGGAAPKVQPRAIEAAKRHAPRRVVWHDQADPLSQALAKRLSRRPSSRRASPR